MSSLPQKPKRNNSILNYLKPVECPDPKPNLASPSNVALVEKDDIEPCPFKASRLEPKEVEATSSYERDPGLRAQIYEYPVNEREDVRRAYMKMRPYQTKSNGPFTQNGGQRRIFCKKWFKQFPWIEYSPTTDSVYCFPCFLVETNPPKYSTFTIEGFRSWKRVNEGKSFSLLQHVGGPSSYHMKAVGSYEDLKKSSHHIDQVLSTISKEDILKARLLLRATIEALRWLALRRCSFRGHDESIASDNRGNFIELLKFLASFNPEIYNVILENAPKNASYTSPKIQKQILHILGERVRNNIRDEVGDSKFCILVDEAQDSSMKEQMSIVLRFVDVGGFVRERFFKIVGVDDTNALTLKKAICDVFSHYNLEVANMRGQGYDGASNMRGAWNGLQALFLKECPFAYYVHCFAHRLQLPLVASSKADHEVWLFFSKLSIVVNLVVASSKRQSELQKAFANEIIEC